MLKQYVSAFDELVLFMKTLKSITARRLFHMSF